jgi:hypothetical protein
VRRRLWIVVTVLWALVWTRPALAEEGRSSTGAPVQGATSGEDEEAARSLYLQGERDEEALRFDDAVAHYDASLARLPSSRYAQGAAARSLALKSHSEGDFAPLVRLETVRRDPLLANSPEAIGSLAKDAESFPRGPVRVEARLLAAEAYRARLHRPDQQIALLWLVVRDPSASDVESREAAVEIVLAEIARGDLDAATRAQAELGTKLDAAHASMVARLLRRRRALAVAKPELGLVLLLFGIAVTKRGVGAAAEAALRVLPLAAAFALFVGAGGGLLASSYDAGNAAPFLVLAPVILGVILLARAWGAVGSREAPARVFRAILCASSLCAVALLLFDELMPQYLEGLGL